MDIGTLAEGFTALGTIVLAIATYRSTNEAHLEAKRDRIAKEMDLLISPLMIVYREIDSRGVDGGWWNLYIGPMRIMTDPLAAQRFRDAVKSIEQYRYLAPENLRYLIDDFLFRIKDIERGKDSGNFSDFQLLLIDATKHLYYSGNVKGGLVEHRYGELTQEQDSLNKSMVFKISEFILSTRQRIHKKSPILLEDYR